METEQIEQRLRNITNELSVIEEQQKKLIEEQTSLTFLLEQYFEDMIGL